MKKILISIRPEWVVKILNGEKTIEIRKTAPKCELPCEVYIYCTKENRYDELLVYNKDQKVAVLNKSRAFYLDDIKRFPHLQKLNGKVVAKFTLNKVHEINKDLVGDEEYESYKERCYESREIKEAELLKLSCLDYLDLRFYLDPHDYPKRGKVGYAWHIDKLVIFDKPKELEEFEFPNPSGIRYIGQRAIKGLPSKKRPPQSWCYVEVSE